MAADIGASLDPKYTNYFAEPADEEGKARVEAYVKWVRDSFGKKGADKGEPVPEEFYPRTVRLVKGEQLFDYNGYVRGGVIVSKRLKDAVEATEPGVHQFIPVEVLHKDDTPYGEPFWYFIICSRIDAVDPSRGGVEKLFYTAAPDKFPDKYFWEIKTGGRSKLAVSKEKTAGRAAWRDTRYTTGTFFSDALIERMKAEGMEGWVADTYWEEI